MRRVAATCALAVIVCACSLDPFPGGGPATAAPLPEAERFTSRGFNVELEPTVLLWGREAHISVARVVRDTLTKVEGELSGSPAHIRIQAGSYRVIPDVGIGGLTDPILGDIEVSMDQRSPVTLTQMLKTWLPLALAHELHHSKRIIDGPGYGTTVGHALITEGSAEAFVRETFPDAPPIPWVRPLSHDEALAVWERVQREKDDTAIGPLHEAWFYGRGGLPRWAGYRIGYAIARSYLRSHPDRTAAELALMSAGEVFAGSGYDPRRTESDNG